MERFNVSYNKNNNKTQPEIAALIISDNYCAKLKFSEEKIIIDIH